ncbi:MAG: hypothetical protein FWC40_03390 [Proteobacteria bacterium]|nr:hypothetical protein [Pseudomonadota bacterium]
MNNLVRVQGRRKKTVLAIALGGSVLSFVFLPWIVGVLLLVLSGYLFWDLMKFFAKTGQRF